MWGEECTIVHSCSIATKARPISKNLCYSHRRDIKLFLFLFLLSFSINFFSPPLIDHELPSLAWKWLWWSPSLLHHWSEYVSLERSRWDRNWRDVMAQHSEFWLTWTSGLIIITIFFFYLCVFGWITIFFFFFC
jgi:hypothetical protein